MNDPQPSKKAKKPAVTAERLGTSASPEAARRTTAILEVLAGVRTAGEAAVALKITVNHYYLLERRALQGLIEACELQPKGRAGPSLEDVVARLQRDLEESQRECMRQAALVRAIQKTVGLPATREKRPTKKQGARRKKGQRKPTVRALRAANAVKKNSSVQQSECEVEQSEVTVTSTASLPSVSPTKTSPSKSKVDVHGGET